MNDVDTLLDACAIIEGAFAKPATKCGVYFLICDQSIVYVGRAIDIDRRLLGHSKKDYDRWAWVSVPAKRQEKVERAYLDKFVPILNRDFYTLTARRAAIPLVESLTTLEPRIRQGRLTPKGCYWRGNTLWARARINGVEYRRTLGTSSPSEAIRRRKEWVKDRAQLGAQSNVATITKSDITFKIDKTGGGKGIRTLGIPLRNTAV